MLLKSSRAVVEQVGKLMGRSPNVCVAMAIYTNIVLQPNYIIMGALTSNNRNPRTYKLDDC